MCVCEFVCVQVYVTAVVVSCLGSGRMCEHCVGTSGYIMKLTHINNTCTHAHTYSHTHTHSLASSGLLCCKLKWCALLFSVLSRLPGPRWRLCCVLCIKYARLLAHTHTHASFSALFLSVTTARATRCGHNSWPIGIWALGCFYQASYR